MKDRSHDEARAAAGQDDPASVAERVKSLLDDGEQDNWLIASRQINTVGLFDRTAVRYEVACDVIGALIANYAEALAFEREKPAPDAATVERIRAAKHALRVEREELTPSNAEVIEAVIRKYGPMARALYQAGPRTYCATVAC
jgi:hypothetical protein